jgi:hypothetical protein
MRLRTLAFAFLLAAFAFSARAAGLEALARQATAENTDEARAAVAQLRAQGPKGLDALFQAHEAEIKKRLQADAALYSNPNDANWLRIIAALDGVAQQKDSYAARLFWFTDLEQAKAEARKTGKPILSLRLLGNLTDEFSCANSRFFRAALYSNAQVSQYLREHFILHWSSERPAPRVTIDYGDGRKWETTVTGNSIHYILDEKGRVLDALPGLYGPAAFLRAFQQAEKFAISVRGQSDGALAFAIRNYHNSRLRQLNNAWAADLAKAGVDLKRPALPVAQPNAPITVAPATAAAPLAVTKSSVEVRLVRELVPDPNNLSAITDEVAWQKIAALHAADAQLDANSRALMARHLPPPVVNRKLSPEGRLNVLVENFQRLIALDTVRNEYLLRPRLAAWLGNAPAISWDELNKRVYSELFLTPRTDPWLGLYGPDVYTGLENGGVQP